MSLVSSCAYIHEACHWEAVVMQPTKHMCLVGTCCAPVEHVSVICHVIWLYATALKLLDFDF